MRKINFDEKTEDFLRERILARVDDDLVTKMEGTLTYEILNADALENKQLYVEFEEAYNDIFLDTAQGDALIEICSRLGCQRKSATYASGYINVSGIEDTIVLKGTSVETDSGLIYYTTGEIVINNGVAIIPVRASETGTDYNISASKITKFSYSITGITSITNNNPIGGGAVIEDLETLRERTQAKLKNPVTTGNITQYIEWAKSISGVNDCQVLEDWNGPLSILLYLIDDDKEPCDQGTCDKVKAYLDIVRPPGATPSVTPALLKNVNVVSQIVLAEDYELSSVKEQIRVNLELYFKEISFQETYVSYAKINSIIVNTSGVKDSLNLTINDDTTFISLITGEIPYLKSFTATVV